jgi:hypothetical protein
MHDTTPGKEATALREFVDALDRSDRLILLLHFADGLTPSEISMLVDRSVPGVPGVPGVEARLRTLMAGARAALGARSQPAAAVA